MPVGCAHSLSDGPKRYYNVMTLHNKYKAVMTTYKMHMGTQQIDPAPREILHLRPAEALNNATDRTDLVSGLTERPKNLCNRSE